MDRWQWMTMSKAARIRYLLWDMVKRNWIIPLWLIAICEVFK